MTVFRLYSVHSEDGRGPMKYNGRTTEVSVAKKHLHDINGNPYSSGQVCWEDDKQEFCAHYENEIDRYI